jgi:hypothetical protein
MRSISEEPYLRTVEKPVPPAGRERSVLSPP